MVHDGARQVHGRGGRQSLDRGWSLVRLSRDPVLWPRRLADVLVPDRPGGEQAPHCGFDGLVVEGGALSFGFLREQRGGEVCALLVADVAVRLGEAGEQREEYLVGLGFLRGAVKRAGTRHW